MKERLEGRLTELKAEYQSGQKMLAELEAKQASLKTTLLRISGGIQVLEEEIAKADRLRPQPDEQHSNGGVIEEACSISQEEMPAHTA